MIKINDLNFRYSKKKEVYNNLNLSIKEGTIAAILGLNGAGKTTLLNLITGFLIPRNGTCNVLGYPSFKRKAEMLQELFLVSDISEFPNTSVEKFYKLYVEFYPKFDMSFFHHCISEFNLSINNQLKRLSLGERRKVMLSFALATNCQLLLFDEPTNGLDIPSKSTFRKLVTANIQEKQTIIFATHQVRDLSNLIDRVIIEHQGRIIINEATEQISQKLVFGKHKDQIKNGDLLYINEGIITNESVSINRDTQPSQLDLELLFNAAISKPKELSELF